MDIEVKIPNIGSDIVEVTEILVKVGDLVKKNDALITVEGQKASIEIPSSYNGIVKEIKVNIGSKVASDSLIIILKSYNESKSVLSDSVVTLNKTNNKTSNLFNNKISKIDSIDQDTLVHASPSVRRLAKKLCIPLSNITGSGRKKRILKEDIALYQNKMMKKASNDVQSSQLVNKNNLNVNNLNQFKTFKLTKIQINSSKNLTKIWSKVPHVTQFDESDITELEEFRKNYNTSVKDSQIKLTLLVFIMTAVSKALHQFPKFNSSFSNSDSFTLINKGNINIGIAVDTSVGLLVPVINNVDKKNISQLSNELTLSIKKAREGKLSLFDLKEGSFTISSLGGIGGTGFTPLINYPEVAILGVSKASIKPIWDGMKFVPRLILPLSLSYDHRAVDGAEAVRFISFINKILSDIRLLLI